MGLVSKANQCLSIMHPNRLTHSPVRLKRRSVDVSYDRLKIPLTDRSPLTEIETKRQLFKPLRIELKPAFEPESPATVATATTASTFTSRTSRHSELTMDTPRRTPA